MNKARLQDSNTQLRFICEDLRAIQTVIATVEGEKAISCEHETLIVVLRALSPIIRDLEETIQNLAEVSGESCEQLRDLE